MRLAALAVWACTSLWGQQHFDVYATFGNPGSRAYRVEGTNITAAGSNVFSSELGFGFHLTQLASTGVWLDVSQIFGSPDDLQASVPGSGRSTWEAYVAAVRVMAPGYKRFTPYGLIGPGGGLFHTVAVQGGDRPSVSTIRAYHGLFAFGGGLDFRLLRWFSLRADFRDVVTGRQLSGAAGRQHMLPTFGIAFGH